MAEVARGVVLRDVRVRPDRDPALTRLPAGRRPRRTGRPAGPTPSLPHHARTACRAHRADRDADRLRRHVPGAGAGRPGGTPRPQPRPLGNREPPPPCPRLHLRRGLMPHQVQAPAPQPGLPDQRRRLHRPTQRALQPPAPSQPPLRRPAGRGPARGGRNPSPTLKPPPTPSRTPGGRPDAPIRGKTPKNPSRQPENLRKTQTRTTTPQSHRSAENETPTLKWPCTPTAVLILVVVRGSGRVRGVRLMSGWEWDAEFRAAGRRYRR